MILRQNFGLSATVQGGDNKSRVAVKVTYSSCRVGLKS
jgi:hypothetical protein